MVSPNGRHNVRDNAKKVVARPRTRLFFLGLCSAALSAAGPAAADTERASRLDLPSCVAADSEPVPLVVRTGEGAYVDAAGRRFFAAGLFPFDAKMPGSGPTPGAVSANAAGLAAIPLGDANRWGLIPAWIVRSTGRGARLLQAEILEAGGGLFMPGKTTEPCAGLLRRAELKARRSGSGIWEGPAGRKILSASAPASFKGKAGQVVVARGRIVSLGKTRSTRYLNFGRHWKTDFTVTLKSSDEDAFNAFHATTGWRMEDLAGHFVEVRGVLQDRDGPYISLRHPGQLVVLERKRGESGG